MLKHNIAIHCDTYDKSDRLLGLLINNGYYWGMPLGHTCWNNYKENIFFSVDDLIENIILEFLKKDTIDSNKLIKILNEKNEHTNWYEIQSNINQNMQGVEQNLV